MKKLSAFGITIIFVTLCSLSCQKKEFDDVQSSLNGAHTYSFQLTEGIDSKVSLATNGKTAWEAGDQIFIHGQKVGYSGDEYYSRIVTLSAGDISADGKTATFTMDDIVADKSWGRTGYNATLFAAYPASAISTYSNSESWYYTSSFKDANNLLLAGCNDVTVNDGHTFAFTNLCGALSFVVSGDFDSYILSGNSGETVGYEQFAVRVDADESFGDKNDVPHLTGSGKLTTGPMTSVSGEVTSDGSTMNYVYFPGGVNLSGGFVIKFLKAGNIEKVISTQTGKNIAIGKYLNLGDVTSYLIDPPSNHDSSISMVGATDLSATASANCYIVDGSVAVNAGKVFTFKAYKGNSSVGVGEIDSVNIIWETYNNAESVTANSIIGAVDYDKQDANDFYTIVFRMPATIKPGNALIAAKNKEGDILWSWHIWVPSSTITSIDAGIHTTAVMDRNLGALDVAVAGAAKINVNTMGMWYQWGRKDPFPGPRSIDVEGEYPGFAKVSGTSPVAEKIQLSLEESIKRPTTFARGLYVESTLTNNDWLAAPESPNGALWGDGTTKQIYDPCPVGYRVPNRESEKPLWKTNMSEATGWNFSSDYYWFTVGSPAVVFPCGGYCDGGTAKTTFRTVIWNAHHDSAGSGDTAYNIYVYVSSGTPKFGNYAHGKSRGNYVRCVVDE